MDRFAAFVDAGAAKVAKLANWLMLAVVLIAAWNAIARYAGRAFGSDLSSNAFLELQWYLFGIIFLGAGAYTLQRNARSVSVMTSPTGAEISVDGEWIATTAGSAPPGHELALMSKGLRAEDVSAPAVIPFLAAGVHTLRVEKDCYAPLEADCSVTLDG